jgi:hypothetical protein
VLGARRELAAVAVVTAYNELRFTCPARHRSFLDRFRICVDGHRPDPATLHTRQIEWSEFRGHRMTCSAATCVDCGLPIVNMVATIWGVRMHDEHDQEQEWADTVNAGGEVIAPIPEETDRA